MKAITAKLEIDGKEYDLSVILPDDKATKDIMITNFLLAIKRQILSVEGE
jgi:hypothetical protein